MKIALFGATGTIGQRILQEALSRGHEVTAIARDTSKITEQNANLHVQTANILDAASVAKVATGQDAVVSAFAPSGGQALETLVEATRSLIAGLTQAGVKRLVIVGGAGSLEVAPGVQLVDTPEFPVAWKFLALAHRDALNVIKAEGSDLDWTNFSPAAFIQPGERTGTFRLGTDQLIVDSEGNSKISAEDYAIALIDELESPKYLKQRFTAAY